MSVSEPYHSLSGDSTGGSGLSGLEVLGKETLEGWTRYGQEGERLRCCRMEDEEVEP